MVTGISATVIPIGVKFCTTVHIGIFFSPFGGGTHMIPKIWPFNISKTVSHIIHVNYSLTSARRDLSKNVSYEAVAPPGESIINKNMLHFWAFLQYHLWAMRDHRCVAMPRIVCIWKTTAALVITCVEQRCHQQLLIGILWNTTPSLI